MAQPLIRTIHPLGFPWHTVNPFLFCVHHLDAYPAGNEALGPAAPLVGRNLGNDFEARDGWRMYHGQAVPGFPQHPHRGFETVTIVRQGFIDHSDSLGATARFGPGDVQWLTAGKGIVHCEMFPLVHQSRPNPTELFQIWLNLPRANKMVEPHFSMLWSGRIPRPVFTDAAGKKTQVQVVAGALGQVKPPSAPPRSWASAADSDVAIWTVKLEKGARWVMPPARPGSNRAVYFFDGETLELGGERVQRGHGVEVEAAVALPLHAVGAAAEVLVLQGKPIDEPVVQYGPFVMNTPQEIQQAFADYRRTEFGGWPWRRDDPVHPRQQGRFARHADGREEQGA